MRCLGCMTEYPSEYGVCPHCGYEPGTPAESALHMQPGSILAGRYLIGRVIGYGGFGVTYISWDDTLRQRVAIKEYLPSEFATRAVGQTQVTVFGGNKAQQFVDGMVKFIDEAKRLAKFQNEPGIVRIYDSFEANNTAYIVMEYLDGETLTAYLDREGRVPVEQAIEMLTPVIRSLEAVHKVGIIHRDIAPDNIMLTKDGHVKLIDFGAARYATTSHSRSLTVIIKPGYSPEEQYRSRGDQGPHTDVYALAAVLYRMVTGITPPDALERRAFYENKKKDILIPVSKNCKIEKSKENAILNAMNVCIEDRTKTAEDFLKELTSTTPVKRFAGKIKAIDLMKWPLWAKIIIPAGGAAAVVLFALLLTGRIGFTNDLITSFTMGADMTRVPSVINCSIGVAQDRLDAQGLASVISGRETSDIIPANMVLRQGIDAGEVVAKGSSVELYVSAAAEPVVEDGTMPDVSFYTAAEARAMLEQLGAVVTVGEEYSSDVAEGIVIRASVGYGEPLVEGDAVTLYVSQGPNPSIPTFSSSGSVGTIESTEASEVTTWPAQTPSTPTPGPNYPPNLVGLDLNSAISSCIAGGYTYTIEYYLGGNGTIISQLPDSATSVDSGCNIQLNVGISAAEFSDKLLEQINIKRSAVGAAPLSRSSSLDYACQILAAEDVDSVSCIRPDGSHWSSVISENDIYLSDGIFTTRNSAYSLSDTASKLKYSSNSYGDGHLLTPEYNIIGIAFSSNNMVVIIAGY